MKKILDLGEAAGAIDKLVIFITNFYFQMSEKIVPV